MKDGASEGSYSKLVLDGEGAVVESRISYFLNGLTGGYFVLKLDIVYSYVHKVTVKGRQFLFVIDMHHFQHALHLHHKDLWMQQEYPTRSKQWLPVNQLLILCIEYVPIDRVLHIVQTGI